MPGFSAQVGINASAKQIFDFISNVEKMPLYLPTLRKATRLDDDHIHLEGVEHGRSYSLDGQFSCDDDAMRMSWRSEDTHKYHGDFQVFDTDDGAELACRIEFEPHLETMKRLAGAQADGEAFMQSSLDAVLQNIKQEVEGSSSNVSSAKQN
jgi:ribosome-associated toxin RatA of RatAB toxin-antitoxin module